MNTEQAIKRHLMGVARCARFSFGPMRAGRAFRHAPAKVGAMFPATRFKMKDGAAVMGGARQSVQEQRYLFGKPVNERHRLYQVLNVVFHAPPLCIENANLLAKAFRPDFEVFRPNSYRNNKAIRHARFAKRMTASARVSSGSNVFYRGGNPEDQKSAERKESILWMVLSVEEQRAANATHQAKDCGVRG